MMTCNQLIAYSLVALILFAVAFYRSSTGPDPGPTPKIDIKLLKQV